MLSATATIKWQFMRLAFGTYLDGCVLIFNRWMWIFIPACTRPRRLARPRTSPFHGGNTGSNPVGDAKPNQQLRRMRRFPAVHWRYTEILPELSGRLCIALLALSALTPAHKHPMSL